MEKRKVLLTGAVGCAASVMNAFNALALGEISNDVKPEDFSDMTLESAPGIILGVTFWVLRLIGILLIIAGIYAMASCNKDGDADGINLAWIKVIAGALFIGMPSVLGAIGIIGR